MSVKYQSAVFVAIALPISWFFGWLFAHDPARFGWAIRVTMCVPGLVGFLVAWRLRGETPLATGLAFTNLWHWVFPVFYVVGMLGGCLGLAYFWRLVSGHSDFIRFDPRHLEAAMGVSKWNRFREVSGWFLWEVLAWAALAWVIRIFWGNRISNGRRARWRWGWLALAVTAILYTTALVPGELGEELGWRGFLIRISAADPVGGSLFTVPVWAAFHIPFAFGPLKASGISAQMWFLASIGMAAIPFAGLYRWSGTVWAPAVAHMAWNSYVQFVLGDVYNGKPGLFVGTGTHLFNAEGCFGAITNGLIGLVLIVLWVRKKEGHHP